MPVPDFSWDEHVQRLSEAQFKLRYRLSFHSFNKLLAILAPSLAVTNEKQACNCRSGKPVELPTRLAAALRYFAGGDPQDLMLIYGMSKMMIMVTYVNPSLAFNLVHRCWSLMAAAKNGRCTPWKCWCGKRMRSWLREPFLGLTSVQCDART